MWQSATAVKPEPGFVSQAALANRSPVADRQARTADGAAAFPASNVARYGGRGSSQALGSTAVQAGFAKVLIDPLPGTPADAMKLASWRRVASRFTPE